MAAAPPEVHVVHPPLPAPVTLEDPKFTDCLKDKGMICMTPGAAQAELRNKAKVGRWMSRMSSIVHFYRSLDQKAAP